MHKNASITAREVHDHSGSVLQRCLKLPDYSRKCTASVLYTVLLYATARSISLSRGAGRLGLAPSDETMRKALVQTLPQVEELERQINRGLELDLPKVLRRRAYPVAIDLHDIPYYGNAEGRKDELVRHPQKQGTTRSHSYATACVVRKGYRFTVAMTWVRGNEPLENVVKRLLHQITAHGVKTRYLLLDREFYNVSVIRSLQAGRRRFVIPVVHRGRTPKDPAQARGTRQFLRWKHSGWSSYSWRDKEGRKATVDICVKGRYYKHKGRRRRQILVFACWGVRSYSPTWTREKYRRRFGIETSYRQTEQARISTSTADPVRRLLFVGIALIMRNAWVWFHLVVLAEKLSGGALKLRLYLMRYDKMLNMIERYVEAHLADESLMFVKAPS